jgi:hypothetical protein
MTYNYTQQELDTLDYVSLHNRDDFDSISFIHWLVENDLYVPMEISIIEVQVDGPVLQTVYMAPWKITGDNLRESISKIIDCAVAISGILKDEAGLSTHDAVDQSWEWLRSTMTRLLIGFPEEAAIIIEETLNSDGRQN